MAIAMCCASIEKRDTVGGLGVAAGQEPPPATAALPDAEAPASQQLAGAIARALEAPGEQTDRQPEPTQPHDQTADKRRQALTAVETVSLTEFEAAWKINLNVDQQPAQQVLERLVAEMGLRIANGAEHAAALNQPVSIQLTGVSRLQAVESLCSQIGLYPDYRRQFDWPNANPFAAVLPGLTVPGNPTPQPAAPKPEADQLPAVTLQSGQRPVPLVFAGPFALAVLDLQEYPPDATGCLDVCLFVGGIPASLATRWGRQNRSSGPVVGQQTPSFSAWREREGRDVLMPGSRTFQIGGTCVLPCQTTQLQLRNLLRDVQTLRLVTDITAVLPTKIETIHFADLSVTPVTRGTEYPLTVQKVRSRPRTQTASPAGPCTMVLTTPGDFATPIEFIPLDAEGQVISIRSVTSSGSGTGGYYRLRGPGVESMRNQIQAQTLVRTHHVLEMPDVPKELIARVLLVEQKVSYPVELVVNLSSWSDQPEQLTPLQYDGSRPIEIEVLQIRTESPFRVVDVKLKNNSNKHIRHIDATMHYLDSAGAVLKKQVAMLATPSEPGDSRGLLVRAKATQEASATAFFAPDTMDAVAFVLGRVYFVDGTDWVPPAQ